MKTCESASNKSGGVMKCDVTSLEHKSPHFTAKLKFCNLQVSSQPKNFCLLVRDAALNFWHSISACVARGWGVEMLGKWEVKNVGEVKVLGK